MNANESIQIPNARATIRHFRSKHFLNGEPAYLVDGVLLPGFKWLDHENGEIDPSTIDLLSEDETSNVKTNAGMDFIHLQAYGSSGLEANGLNWIALSDDSLVETAASTTLSNEIVANGLARAQGTVSHTPGAATTTIAKVFTATGAQTCQKAALFTAASAGIMNHPLAFTQRSLQNGDTIQLTYTITIS